MKDHKVTALCKYVEKIEKNGIYNKNTLKSMLKREEILKVK